MTLALAILVKVLGFTSEFELSWILHVHPQQAGVFLHSSQLLHDDPGHQAQDQGGR